MKPKRKRRKRRKPLPPLKRSNLAMLALPNVVKPGQEGAAQLVAEALSLALDNLEQSTTPWYPDHALVVGADETTGDELISSLIPIEVVIRDCPWLNDGERAAVAAPLQIDERRVVLSIFGYTATVKYIVPNGTTSN